MASIEKRGDSYRIVVSSCSGDGKRTKQTLLYKPKAKTPSVVQRELQKQAALFEEQVKSGNIFSGDSIRFSEYMKKWETEWADSHIRERTKADYISLINMYGLPVFGNMKMSKIMPETIQGIITRLNKDHAPATVRKIVTAFDSVFRYAYRMRVINENPVKRCELPRLKPKNNATEMQFFTPEQAKTFLSAIQKPYTDVYVKRNGTSYVQSRTMPTQLQAFFTIALYSGLRRGEMLALTWHDIDFDECTISVTKATEKLRTGEQRIKDPKTRAGYRSVQLPPECFRILKKWRVEERQLVFTLRGQWQGADSHHFDDNFIFVDAATGLQMHSDTPFATFKRFITRYNADCENEADKLPQIRLHDLRHTSATLLLSANMDIEEVSRRLGHSKPSVTLDVYGHALPQKNSEAAGILERILG